MATIPRVALLIETSREYGREVLRGVMRYARLHGPWAFYITPGDFMQAVPKIKQWGGTGIIARIETAAVGKALLATK
jgi:LacI family transcriptional regulator